MRALIITGLVALAAVGGAGPGGKKSFPDPTPRKDAILQRFVAEFVPLTPGEGQFPAKFTIGSADGPKAERPAREVAMRPFAVGKYEVTQELYQVVMGDNPSRWQGPRNSVERMTWDEANAFCRRVTEALRQRRLIGADETVRLPSEAEWEYACRAGTRGRYSFGEDAEELTHYAWFNGNAAGNDPPVGRKRPNPWGLYDMHGYVWEWCLDGWHPTHEGAPADGRPRPAGKAGERVIRGGAWTDGPDAARSAFRRGAPADGRSAAVGFRCVKDTKRPGTEERR